MTQLKKSSLFSRKLSFRNATWVPALGNNGMELFPEQRTMVAKNEYNEDFLVFDGLNGMVQVGNISYVNENSALAAGYKFSLRLRRWAKETDDSFYGYETQFSYHSSARADYSTDADVLKVGVEVEKEDDNLQQNGLAWKLFQDTGWARERDGSLGEGGYELVSPVMGLMNVSKIKKVLKPVQQYLDANHSERCGGHINISCKNRTPIELLQAMKPFAALFYAIYKSRMNVNYCRVRRFNEYSAYPTKYSAFYPKTNVLELRLFPAVKNMTQLMWRIELVRWIFGVATINNQTMTFDNVIEQLNSPNSFLRNHFRKVFTAERIEQIITKAKEFNTTWVGE